MSTLRFLLVLFLALVLPLSSAIPAVDLPETAYDESEEVPYERTSLFSSEVWYQNVHRSRLESIFRTDDSTYAAQASQRVAVREVPAIQDGSVPLSHVDHALRC